MKSAPLEPQGLASFLGMSREMFGMGDLHPLSQPRLLVGQLSHWHGILPSYW